jgi:hypothetical protein
VKESEMMRRTGPLVAAALLLGPGAPLVAQEAPGAISQVIVTHAKAGMGKQYQEGRKRHMAWHKKQNDSWIWTTWEVTSGPSTGAFLSLSPGHTWKDFDDWEARLGQGDAMDVDANLTPHAESTTISYYQFLSDLSRPALATPKMSEVIHFLLKPEKEVEFRQAQLRVHEAIGKTSWPARYSWYALVNGGEGPHFVLVLPRESYAEMAEPELSFSGMLTKAFGSYEAGVLLGTIAQSAKSQWSELLVYRPDLSHVPTP